MNKKTNKKQKDKKQNFKLILSLCRRHSVFVSNFEPLNLRFVCNLWFVICDFQASQAFLAPARLG